MYKDIKSLKKNNNFIRAMARERVENMKNFTIESAWDLLLEMGVSEETLQTVTDINGYNMDAMESILYSRFGYNDFEDMEA